jgi:hypothetical protein
VFALPHTQTDTPALSLYLSLSSPASSPRPGQGVSRLRRTRANF